MKFCPREKCRHWGEATKYPRKCYYEVQCLRGTVDEIFAILDIAWTLRKKKWQIRRVRSMQEDEGKER